MLLCYKYANFLRELCKNVAFTSLKHQESSKTLNLNEPLFAETANKHHFISSVQLLLLSTDEGWPPNDMNESELVLIYLKKPV